MVKVALKIICKWENTSKNSFRELQNPWITSKKELLGSYERAIVYTFQIYYHCSAEYGKVLRSKTSVIVTHFNGFVNSSYFQF